MEKLSSGLRINKAGDDAAGLAISEKMRGQIRGLDMASKNAQDATSLIQTAEGALNETTSILQRMRELAVQASNDTNTGVDRGEIQKEINSLTSEINRIGNTTEFNTQKLLNGEKTTATVAAASGATNVTIGGVAGFNISAGATNGSLANGINITFAEGVTAGAAFNAAGDTVTVTLDTIDTTNAASDIQTLIRAASTNVPSGLDMTQFTVTGGANIDATGVVVNETATLAGGINAGTGLQFQIGANENQSMTLEIEDMRAAALGIAGTMNTGTFTAANTVNNGTNNLANEAALDVSSATNAAAAITKIQSAIEQVSAERSKLGANQNRLEYTVNNLSTSSENLTAAESRIRDVDMAKEMMDQTKNSILSQAAQAMLAQANQRPQGVLQLLR